MLLENDFWQGTKANNSKADSFPLGGALEEK